MKPPMHSSPRLTCTAIAPARAVPSLAEDVRAGMLAPPRSLPPKYFYDELGSRIFEQICHTEEYYPSRTEAALLKARAREIIQACQPDHIIELGSGSARKTRFLLDACGDLQQHCEYWPFDVAEDMLLDSSATLVEDYPWLTVHALVGDYNGGLAQLPLPATGRRLIMFLGGTIGNFEPEAARAMLAEVAALMRPGDFLLLGADRVKDVDVLEAAYDDADGYTARFNLNVLNVLNRELDADFPVADYRHRAVFNAEASRIEMRLRATRDHNVEVKSLGQRLGISEGEEILTEVSRKFSASSLEKMLHSAGFQTEQHHEASESAYSLVVARLPAAV